MSKNWGQASLIKMLFSTGAIALLTALSRDTGKIVPHLPLTLALSEFQSL